jgi:hypothetical protein
MGSGLRVVVANGGCERGVSAWWGRREASDRVLGQVALSEPRCRSAGRPARAQSPAHTWPEMGRGRGSPRHVVPPITSRVDHHARGAGPDLAGTSIRSAPPARRRLLEALLIDWHRGHPHGVRRGRGRSNARLLRRRGPLHSVRPRLCRGLPGIIGLRLPPGCLAVRSRRVRLVGSRTPALVAPNLRRRALTGRGRARTRCSASGGRTRTPRSGYRTPGTRSRSGIPSALPDSLSRPRWPVNSGSVSR